MSAASTALAPQAADPRRFVECRVYERQTCGLQTACQPLAARSSGEIRWRACIRDISEGGVGLVMVRRFERGAALAIELPASEERPADTLLIKVVHVTPQRDGQWLLGGAFVSRLSEDEVRSVVALARRLQPPPNSDASPSRPRAGTSNGRPSPAVPPESPLPPALAIPDLWFEGTTHGGKVVRVRVRRLRLAGSWPLAAGTVLRLWVGDKRRHPDGILVEVVGCRKQARGWLVRYRPVQALTAQALQAFGLAG